MAGSSHRHRHHHGHHRHKKRRDRDGASSGSEDSGPSAEHERKRHRRKKHRSHGEHRRHGKADGERREEEKVAFDPIQADDYFIKNPEFCAWLVQSRDVYFGELGSDEARKLFAGEFVSEWNAGKLENKYYLGMGSGYAVPRTRPAMRTVKESQVAQDALDARRSQLLTRREREEDVRQDQWRSRRDERKKQSKEERHRLEEMFPKATGRDAVFEKRAGARAVARERENERDGSFALADKDIFGGDSFQAARRRQQASTARRDERQELKRIEMQDRLLKHQAKEQARIDQFKDLLKNPIVIKKRE